MKNDCIADKHNLKVEDDDALKEVMISTDMTTSEFWNLATSKTLTIQIPIMENDVKSSSSAAAVSANMSLTVECNVPTVVGISTFEKFGSMLFPHIPLVIETETLFATHTIVDWYVDKKLVCHDSRSYTPTEQDAGKTLSVLIKPVDDHRHDGKGCEEAYQFRKKISSELPHNTTLGLRGAWREARHRDQSSNEDEALRILSYNILADQNTACGNTATADGEVDSQFPWVSADILKRTRRMPLILYEILEYKADIICLQEVEEGIFKSLFLPVLEYHNYQGYFAGKQQDGIQEGCAMFWSLDRFEKSSNDERQIFSLNNLVAKYLIDPIDDDGNNDVENNESFANEWNESSHDLRELLQKRTDLADTIKTKLGHVLQVVQLRELKSQKPITVANDTHKTSIPNHRRNKNKKTRNMSETEGVTWQGRIVARILPPGIDGAYEQKKPNAKIDPSDLVDGAGPLSKGYGSYPTCHRKHPAAGTVSEKACTLPICWARVPIIVVRADHQKCLSWHVMFPLAKHTKHHVTSIWKNHNRERIRPMPCRKSSPIPV